MNRRASLPGADELFRATAPRTAESTQDGPRAPAHAPETAAAASRRAAAPPEQKEPVSGRVRHDTKITVYLSNQELLDLEQARLRVRAEFAINVDRGRLVREAVGILLRDLEQRGPDSDIVGRLS